MLNGDRLFVLNGKVPKVLTMDDTARKKKKNESNIVKIRNPPP